MIGFQRVPVIADSGIPSRSQPQAAASIDLYRCPACGTYETAAQDGKVAQFPLPDDKKHLISAFVRAHCERTGRAYLFADRGASKTFPLDLPEIPVTERINLALLLVADRSAALGDVVGVDVQTDWPLIWGRNPAELRAILEHLVETKLLTPVTGVETQKPTRVLLSPAGWREAERLRPSRASGTQAFVAMSFAEDLSSAYELGIQPALTECGYSPWRSDRAQFAEKICDRIILEIRRSGLLVADVTFHRQGVYFEAGFAMGLGKPVLWTCREDELDKAHFDTRQYNHVVWKSPDDLRRNLSDRVQALFPTGPLATSRPASP